MKSVIPVLAAIGVARASSDYHGNPSTPYFYSSEIEYDYDAETDHQNDDCRFAENSCQLVSSLSIGNGCYVSSQAIMCSGGGDPLQQLDSLMESDEDFTDDEDDDEDDGHSSMLSNASIRSKVSIGGASSSNASNHPTMRKSHRKASQVGRNLKLNQPSKPSSAALQLRGGSFVSIAKSEVSKKLIVAAIVTLLFEGCMGHVMEFFKIVMQTSPAGTTYGQVFKDITQEKGIGGLWDGFVPWGVVQAVLKGGVFGLAHAAAMNVLVPLAEGGKIPMQLAVTLAGGIGGGFQGYVLSPTLLMKTRVMTNPVFREKMSLIRTTWLSFAIGAEVIKKEGMSALMKGANVFATKRVFDWSSRYFFSDLFESLFTNLKGAPLTGIEKGLASFLGGVASTCVTLPLDVLVAKMQDAKKAGVAVSPFKLFKDELDELGLSGLQKKYMQGFEARLLHVCLTTVVLKTGAPIVYNKLFGGSK